MSVLAQTYENIELIVMDGGSTDGSVQILQRLGDRLYFRSGQDGGQVNAINEGFRIATGDVLTWLNSDDIFFTSDVLATVVSHFKAEPSSGAVFGDFVVIDRDGRTLQGRKQTAFDYNALLYGYCFITPSLFIRRGAVERYGLLDESFRFIFDWEYYLRLGKVGARVSLVKRYLFGHRFHDASITVGTPEKQNNEIERLRAKYEPGGGWLVRLTRTAVGRWGVKGYYRAKRWALRAMLRGQLDLPLSSGRILRHLGR